MSDDAADFLFRYARSLGMEKAPGETEEECKKRIRAKLDGPPFCAVCWGEVKPEDSAEDSGHVFHRTCLEGMLALAGKEGTP